MAIHSKSRMYKVDSEPSLLMLGICFCLPKRRGQYESRNIFCTVRSRKEIRFLRWKRKQIFHSSVGTYGRRFGKQTSIRTPHVSRAQQKQATEYFVLGTRSSTDEFLCLWKTMCLHNAVVTFSHIARHQTSGTTWANQQHELIHSSTRAPRTIERMVWLRGWTLHTLLVFDPQELLIIHFTSAGTETLRSRLRIQVLARPTQMVNTQLLSPTEEIASREACRLQKELFKTIKHCTNDT